MRKPAFLLAIVASAVAASCAGDEHATRIVTVPHVTERDVVGAYDLLHAAGLRVAIRNRFDAGSLCLPIAQEQFPPAGAPSPVGSVVTISAGFCPLGSPAVTKRRALVPSFKGKLASEAVAWAERSGMFWSMRRLPPLSAGFAPHLFDNYRVVRQQPAPGSRLCPGVIVRVAGSRGFRPTPITVWVEAV